MLDVVLKVLEVVLNVLEFVLNVLEVVLYALEMLEGMRRVLLCRLGDVEAEICLL